MEYEKISQREHILLKSEMYVGNVSKSLYKEWVLNENNKFEKQNISYTYALLKIFDEIISNAQDEVLRNNNVSYIKIDIDYQNNIISIMNDGNSIPITYFKDTKDYIPTVLFGHFLTSSNYKDNDKTWIGNFGFGAKLTNVFSKIFIVEIYNKDSSTLFSQTWQKNMKVVYPPTITEYKDKKSYIKIIFKPDLKRLNTDSLTEIKPVFNKRIYDLAGNVNKINIYLNNNKIYYKSFKNYIEDYPFGSPDLYIETDNYKCGIIISENSGDQISFINGNITSLGGTHVNFFINTILKYIKNNNKKLAEIIKPAQIKNNIIIFLSCIVINPKFNSQTKNQLISAYSTEIDEKFLKKINSSVLINIISKNELSKLDSKLIKNQGKKSSTITGIPKLDDANYAGTRYSDKCTLILTEGDSAKSLAIAGISVIGRDYFGVFPLKGKLLNVKEATKKQLITNEEINNIVKILGLKYNQEISIKNLRYGRIMLMTDQDHDGSHIKGLIINFIHTFWPNLLKEEYIKEFITPIVKCTNKNKVLMFYNLKDYNNWKESTENSSKYTIKYYKGLGTSTSIEIKQYFKVIDNHTYYFKFEDDDDYEINKAFSKDFIKERKKWLENIDHNDILYNNISTNKIITYKDFINKELIHFSNADNIRSIPNIIDGLKPGQRKILYVLFDLPDKEIKVEQLSGIVSAKTAYHHGEESLKCTIVHLAHDFVGSNNINILEPIGQFGTRLLGGKDKASPRYIYTKLNPIIKYIFKEEDKNILTYQEEENLSIEPEYYIPIIPMVLINGARGIGTGWSTYIANYNILDIVKELILMIQEDRKADFKAIKPWYRKFNGYIYDNLILQGKLYINPKENRIIITELPIGTWTQTYKETFLESNGDIIKYSENHSDEEVYYDIILEENVFKELLDKDNFLKYFKLIIKINTSNMVCFNSKKQIQLYKNINEIMDEFYIIRYNAYIKRKKYLLSQLKNKINILINQVKFITDICNRDIVIERKNKTELLQILSRYDEINGNYDYLINMPLYSLTLEKITELSNKLKKEQDKYNNLLKTSIKELWINDLEELLKNYKNNKYKLNNIVPDNFIEIKYG
jgi:DNA topoisomerase II